MADGTLSSDVVLIRKHTKIWWNCANTYMYDSIVNIIEYFGTKIEWSWNPFNESVGKSQWCIWETIICILSGNIYLSKHY